MMIRVIVYGAGRGGQLVAEILDLDSQATVVGFVDDNAGLWQREVAGHPVVGGGAALEELRRSEYFDALVLSMATPTTMDARRKLYIDLKADGFEFINAIHPAAIISASAHLGENNVISAGAIMGAGARIGSDNRVSAHCNIEHHSVVGSHNFFSSHCVTGGAVAIGDSCVFGLGCVIESLLHIGNDVLIASGAVVTEDLADGTVIDRGCGG